MRLALAPFRQALRSGVFAHAGKPCIHVAIRASGTAQSARNAKTLNMKSSHSRSVSRSCVAGTAEETQATPVEGGQPVEDEAPSAPPLPISQLDFRVGRIVEISKHPDADSLFVEKVDMGEDEPRTIISGLVAYQTEEQLQGRLVVVLASLKARNMRGIKSHGMLLCASNEAHDQVEPLRPAEGSQPGERVFFGENGSSQPPPESPNKVAKKKIWEGLQPDLCTTDDKLASWKEHTMMTSSGPILADTIAKGKIS